MKITILIDDKEITTNWLTTTQVVPAVEADDDEHLPDEKSVHAAVKAICPAFTDACVFLFNHLLRVHVGRPFGQDHTREVVAAEFKEAFEAEICNLNGGLWPKKKAKREGLQETAYLSMVACFGKATELATKFASKISRERVEDDSNGNVFVITCNLIEYWGEDAE